jgi:hypothetical protein
LTWGDNLLVVAVTSNGVVVVVVPRAGLEWAWPCGTNKHGLMDPKTKTWPYGVGVLSTVLTRFFANLLDKFLPYNVLPLFLFYFVIPLFHRKCLDFSKTWMNLDII